MIQTLEGMLHLLLFSVFCSRKDLQFRGQ